MKLDHLVIMASDTEVSAQWYNVLLGLIGFAKSRDHVWSNGDGLAIDMRKAKPDVRPYERYGAGLNHLGFTAPTMEALDAVRAGMAAAGFDVPDIQSFDEDRATFFKDPDGMRVEVTYYG